MSRAFLFGDGNWKDKMKTAMMNLTGLAGAAQDPSNDDELREARAEIRLMGMMTECVPQLFLSTLNSLFLA